MKTLAYEARKSHDGLNLNRTRSETPDADLAVLRSMDDLFLKVSSAYAVTANSSAGITSLFVYFSKKHQKTHQDQGEALRRSSELQQANENKSRETFEAWLHKKKETELKKKKLNDEAAFTTKAEKLKKENDGKKAYKKWLRLRKKNMYRSKAEDNAKAIPAVKRAEHYNKGWNKDVDLAEYYGNMENNFL